MIADAGFRNAGPMKFGIVVTARAGSSRVPGKALRKVNGKPLIEHLLQRCLSTDLPVVLATPQTDAESFSYLWGRFHHPNLLTLSGFDDDPLARLSAVAEQEKFDAVIRVTHDKVFIEPELIQLACNTFERKNLDYLYSSQFTDGSRFEIISRQALAAASAKYKNVEYVGYAVRTVTQNIHHLEIPEKFRSPYRFLVDYPNDLTLLETIFATVGQDCTLAQAIAFMQENPWAAKINQLPSLTVYTCAYNAEKWLTKAMGSVFEQQGFRQMEYLLVDDHSTDSTPLLMARASTQFPNVRFIRNASNVGLASSSNVALSEARGEFILRLDADDYLVGKNSLQELTQEIASTGKDAIYPNNYFGSLSKIQNGKECRHVGGAIFRRSALNHVKFTEELRGWEGRDLYLRAKDQINIGYLGKPTFFYRQRKDSMSKGDPVARARLRAEIEERYSAS